jgi:dTDP-4-dehydrorhamnose 3,5-epimerase
MIAGVMIKPLKLIPDERGFLMELLRSDEPVFAAFGQVYITGCKAGIAKGWHYHREQSDYFACVEGTALLVLYDNREASPTCGEVQELILDAPPCTRAEPLLVKIPPLVLHGFTALDCAEARIINVPTLPYRYTNPDEFRYPWNSPEIPYTWPANITSGG